MLVMEQKTMRDPIGFIVEDDLSAIMPGDAIDDYQFLVIRHLKL